MTICQLPRASHPLKPPETKRHRGRQGRSNVALRKRSPLIPSLSKDERTAIEEPFSNRSTVADGTVK